MEKIGKISNTTLFILAGATIYSSELLLNGIVTQKLEYDRLVQILRCKLLPLTRFQKFFFFPVIFSLVQQMAFGFFSF